MTYFPTVVLISPQNQLNSIHNAVAEAIPCPTENTIFSLNDTVTHLAVECKFVVDNLFMTLKATLPLPYYYSCPIHPILAQPLAKLEGKRTGISFPHQANFLTNLKILLFASGLPPAVPSGCSEHFQNHYFIL